MEPRRVSTRYRGEPPPKKRALTPSPPPPSTTRPKQQPPPLPEPIEDGMPVRLKEGQPLPFLMEPQDKTLSGKAFQSISESGVLKDALERSRHKWMTDVFERYWSKPTKKKGIPEAPQPAKESMSKLGTCTMQIEPHTFDITLYTVKEHPLVQYPTFSSAPQTYSQYHPYPQNGTYAPPFGPPFTGSSIPEAKPYPQRRSSQPPLPAFREGFGHVDTQTPPIPPTPSPAPPSSRRMSKSSNSSQESRLKENASTDPVIQMLAQRAGQDTRLKSLMTIVAAGDASSEQLKEFQTHIDELNTLLKSPQSPNPAPTNPYAITRPRPTDTTPGTQSKTATAIPTPMSPRLPPTATSPVKAEPAPPQPAPYQPPYALTAPRTHIFPSTPTPSLVNAQTPNSAILVFDFAGPGSNGDRYLFPRNTILDYQPGNMSVLASFLVIRHGSSVPGGASKIPKSYYKASKQYYEPVTMKLSASHPRLLEPLTRTVSPPEEVKRWMEGVFEKMGRGQRVWLAERLPREKGGEEGVGGENEGGNVGKVGKKEKETEKVKVTGKENLVERERVQAVYEAPGSMMPWPA